jgi:hypothetical protein
MNDAPVRLADHAAYETYWRNQKAWLEAIERDDLAEIFRLFLSGTPIDAVVRPRLEKFAADHRAVRKARGRPPLREKQMKVQAPSGAYVLVPEITIEEAYALAAHDVRELKKAQRRWGKLWKNAKRVKFDLRFKNAEGVETKAPAFSEWMQKDVERLLAIDDPVAHVAKEWGLKVKTLTGEVEGGGSGWGRGPKTPAKKYGHFLAVTPLAQNQHDDARKSWSVLCRSDWCPTPGAVRS